MKKRTLNQTWTLCLRMWRKISREWAEGIMDIHQLKEKWLKENGFEDITADCFFCDYDNASCRSCPGKLIDPEFDCTFTPYDYKDNPPGFYKELLRLNRIRKDIKCKNIKSKSKKR